MYVCMYVCVCVCVCIHVRDIILKLHVWIPHGKKADAYFWFSLNYLPLSNYGPLTNKRMKFCKCSIIFFFSSPEPKAHGELIVYQSSRRPSVRACVRPSLRLSTLSNMIISTTSKPIPTKFYLKHHWGGGKAALCFEPDRIGTLVSMATDSSHKVIMGKIPLAL